MRYISKKPSFRHISLLITVALALTALAQPLTSTVARGGPQAKTGVQTGKPQPAAPTAARLESFAASAYDGGTLIEWRSGFEINNLGFRLYRDEGGKRALITPQLLAGSALVTGQGTPLTAGKSYAWWDGGEAAAVSYWLEELDLEGHSNWHGPITAQVVGGRAPEQARAAMLADLGMAAAPSRPVEARAGLLRPPALKLAAGTLPSQAAVKIYVDHEGWYRVTQPALLAAGLKSNADPRNLQLYVDGQPQPISVTGEGDGHLDAGDAVEFYGMGINSPHTDTRVYWLAVGTQAGLRIASVSSSAPPTAIGSFPFAVERRDRSIYFSSLLNGETENFFGAVVNSSPANQSLTVPHLNAAASGATLQVALQGVTGIFHNVNVQINGNSLGNQSYNAMANSVASYTVPAGLLSEGQNTVTLTAQGGSSDISLVDYLRLTYNHTYMADGDQLKATAASNQPLTIAGFSNNAIRVFDITNPATMQEIVGQVQQQGASYNVSLTPTGGGTRTLLAVTNSQAGQVKQTAANIPSNLTKTGQGADLLIITPRDFFSAVELLRTTRQGQGLSVMVVDIEDIYDEFSFSNKTPQALKDFLSYTHTSWKKKPRYATLVGDASYDEKNYLGIGDFDLVPTKLIDTTFMEASSDDWLADFDDDGVPELALGRLPMRTSEDTERLIAKILSYDDLSVPDEMLLVADSNDGYDFAGASNQLHPLVSGDVRVVDVYRDQLTDAAAHQAVLDAIARGQRVVNYTGHGSVNLWRGSLLSNPDASGMENEFLPVFLLMTCLNGYFNDPSLDCLGEAVLKTQHGGAAAVWASTGQTLPEGQWQMNQEVFRQIFTHSQMRMGDATRAAKQTITDVDVRRTWVLLGDPTMRLK
jgi:Peptidase family C25